MYASIRGEVGVSIGKIYTNFLNARLMILLLLTKSNQGAKYFNFAVLNSSYFFISLIILY